MTGGRSVNVACGYCGLPLKIRRWDGNHAAYCCVGCRIAASVTAADKDERPSQWMLARLGLAIFFTMNVMVFTLAIWSRDVYQVDAASREVAALYDLLRYGCLLFSAPVLLLLGGPLLQQAWAQLRQGALTIDALLALGVIAAFAYSVGSLLSGGEHTYFEVGCMVLVAVTLGRWFEATGKLKTTQALRDLRRLLPESALREDGGNGGEQVPLERIRAGDRIRVLAGQRIPVDGVIQRGTASIDEQLITGEALPREKSSGQAVHGGSLNLDGDLTIGVTAAARDGTIQRLIAAVEAAAAQHGDEQRLADKLASWFVPLVLVVAIATFAIHGRLGGLQSGIMTSLAVVLIACPCALGIATPLAVWAAMSRAAREGVVFRDGESLSRLARVQTVFLDKTGTLTSGESQVERFVTDKESDERTVRRVAASLASASTHPLSLALARFADVPRSSHAVPSGIRHHSGAGVSGMDPILGAQVALGSSRFMQTQGNVIPDGLAAEREAAETAGWPTAFVGWNGRIRGIWAFRERLRPEAATAMDRIKRLGVHQEVLTGDRSCRAKLVGDQLGVPVRSGLLPHEKQDVVHAERQTGTVVAMIGDGVNDAPALAAADIGIAMGCGTDVTRDAGDVCLLSSDLNQISRAISLARRTVRTIRQNLFWACAYNVVGVGLAAVGLLNPIFAAIAMVGSSLFVISNSLRLSAAESSPAPVGSREQPVNGPTPEMNVAAPPREVDMVTTS